MLARNIRYGEVQQCHRDHRMYSGPFVDANVERTVIMINSKHHSLQIMTMTLFPATKDKERVMVVDIMGPLRNACFS